MKLSIGMSRCCLEVSHRRSASCNSASWRFENFLPRFFVQASDFYRNPRIVEPWILQAVKFGWSAKSIQKLVELGTRPIRNGSKWKLLKIHTRSSASMKCERQGSRSACNTGHSQGDASRPYLKRRSSFIFKPRETAVFGRNEFGRQKP